jgi:type I restriction enzyme, S subunit
MELMPGYKQTTAGVIPDDWQLTWLGAHGETYGGLTGKTKKDFGTGDAQYVTFMNVMSNVVIDCDVFDRVHISPAESQNRVRKNDLLFNGSSETPEEVAFCAVHIEDVSDLYLNSFCFGFRLRDHITIAPLFLAYLFRSRTGRELVKVLAQGSTRYNISKRALLGAPLAIPPAPEQQAIAMALSDMDALLASFDQLIGKKRDLKQAAMQQLLSGETRLPGFSGDWDLAEFGDIATIRNEKVLCSSTPEGTPCVELEFIGQANGRLLGYIEATGASSKYSFKKGDVLFGRLRAYLRKHWMATFEGVCSTEIWPLIPRDQGLCGGYLHLLVQMNSFVDAACVSYGTHMPRSDWAVLGKFEVQLPSVPEQIAISTSISDMDAELETLEKNLEKSRLLKQAMMQELLTGKTRLFAKEDIYV